MATSLTGHYTVFSSISHYTAMLYNWLLHDHYTAPSQYSCYSYHTADCITQVYGRLHVQFFIRRHKTASAITLPPPWNALTRPLLYTSLRNFVRHYTATSLIGHYMASSSRSHYTAPSHYNWVLHGQRYFNPCSLTNHYKPIHFYHSVTTCRPDLYGKTDVTPLR